MDPPRGLGKQTSARRLRECLEPERLNVVMSGQGFRDPRVKIHTTTGL